MIVQLLVLFGSFLASSCFGNEAIDFDCDETDNLTLPSKCCYEGHNLLNQETLALCLDQPKIIPIEHLDMESAYNLICYFNESGLIHADTGDLHLNKTMEHFTQNYPIQPDQISLCSNGFTILDLQAEDRADLYPQTFMSFMICLEKFLTHCPEEDRIQSKTCEDLSTYVVNCRTNRILKFVRFLARYLMVVEDRSA